MNVIEVNSGNFRTEVLESSLPVLVDAYSPGCGPCRAIAPILETLAEEVRGQAKVAKFNATEDIYLAAALRIGGYPTLVVFHGGKETARFAGVRSKATLKEALGIADTRNKPILKPDSEVTPKEAEDLIRGVDDIFFGGLQPSRTPEHLAEESRTKKRGSD